MRLEPTPRATHLSWVGLGLLGLGIALEEPHVVTVAVGLVFGVALSRAWTHVSVARARAAGFEMLWTTGGRTVRASRERPVELTLELRNRDAHPTQFQELVVTHAPALEIEAFPREGEIPPHGRLVVTLRVVPRRVGHQGIFGLTVRTVRAPGLFTVPLTFSSPFVVEVLPRPVRLGPEGARGGRAPGRALEVRAGLLRGEGTEFRELRDHQPGDPFRRIAWKASARRGRLLVVDSDREERDAVWFVVDASLESAGGAPGEAPLDRALDQVTRLVELHLANGDRVGVSLVAGRELFRSSLGQGPAHLAEIIQGLAFQSHTADADRSDWDEDDVLARVIDHARTLDAEAFSVDPRNTDALLALTARLRSRAPVDAVAPWAPTARERELRRYLASFGVQSPPRGTPERHRAEREIARVLREISGQRPRPTRVHLFLRSPGFDTQSELLDAIAAFPRRRVAAHFHALEELPLTSEDVGWKSRIVRDALGARLDLETRRAKEELKKRGVRWSAQRPTAHGSLKEEDWSPSSFPERGPDRSPDVPPP